MELQSWWGTSTMTGMTDNLYATYKEGRNKNIKQPPTINPFILILSLHHFLCIWFGMHPYNSNHINNL